MSQRGNGLQIDDPEHQLLDLGGVTQLQWLAHHEQKRPPASERERYRDEVVGTRLADQRIHA